MDKAWYHARQAAFLDPGNQEAVITFNNLMHELELSCNIGKDSSKEEVIAAFGKPDIDSENGCMLRYGLSRLIFKNGKLAERDTISGMRGLWISATPQPL